MNTPTQEQAAYILWLGGFGDDSDRNWYMAGYLIEDPRFDELLAQADTLKGARIADPDQVYLKKEGWLRKFAEMLYDTSYRLAQPSDQPEVNWHAALTFWAALG